MDGTCGLRIGKNETSQKFVSGCMMGVEQEMSEAVLMQSRFRYVAALFLGGVIAVQAAWSHEPIAIIALPDTPAHRQEILAGGYEIDSCHGGDTLRLFAREDELKRLQDRKLNFEIVGYYPDPPAFRKSFPSLGQYHSYDAMTERLESYAEDYPDLARLSSVGQSVQARELWAMKLTRNPDVREEEPQFRYIATMHGDEVVGTEMALYFIDLLLTKYGDTDAEGQRMTWLLDNTEIWIMPLMNPDGQVLGSRFNANGVDLNRNFPSYVLENADGRIFDGDPLRAVGRQPETRAVMEWVAGESFNASANFHGGVVVVNYPFDEGDAPAHTYTASPDDELFIDISKRYSEPNTPMWNSSSFPMGITNGADWYTVYGGMQDWNYRYLSCNEVLVELSVPKRPFESTIPTYWAQNKESMLAYLESVHIGIRGIVSDAATGQPVYARIEIADNDQPVFTDPRLGNYHRMLLPGSYRVTVSAPGYVSQTVQQVEVDDGLATRLDLNLLPEYALEGEEDGEGGGVGPWHNADRSQNNRISLSEILRVIQLFNSSAIHCDELQEDGFAPGSGNEDCMPHSSDYNPQDWQIQLSELLRAVQLYNSQGYEACPDAGSEDGFCLLID